MDNSTLSEFHNLVFGSEKPFDKAFLKKWNNIDCVSRSYLFSEAWTPVEWAAWYGYLDVVKFLVENGADITLHDNFTICMAMSENHVDIVKYLLSTNIYTEECIQEVIVETQDHDIHNLLANYKQFSNTKACR